VPEILLVLLNQPKLTFQPIHKSFKASKSRTFTRLRKRDLHRLEALLWPPMTRCGAMIGAPQLFVFARWMSLSGF